MRRLHLCSLDLVDDGGQPGRVKYFPDVDRGPADNEIAAAIIPGRGRRHGPKDDGAVLTSDHQGPGLRVRSARPQRAQWAHPGVTRRASGH
jgi:hypothetical protein